MVEINIYDPSQLDTDAWRELQSLEREAFANALIYRSKDEVDELVGWDDPARYVVSHLDPNTEVGRRYNPNQIYTRPRVAIATHNHEPLGFAYSAHNISGSSELQRAVKRLTIAHNYLWLREVAVDPDHQGRGIAKALGHTLLKDAIPWQPVAKYTWPQEYQEDFQPKLARYGFKPTGETWVNAFGEDHWPARQVRLQAPSVRSVLKKLC